METILYIFYSLLYYSLWTVGFLLFLCHSTRPLATILRYSKSKIPSFKERYGKSQQESSYAVIIGLDELALAYARTLSQQGFKLLLVKDLSSPYRYSSSEFHAIDGQIEETTFDSATRDFSGMETSLAGKNLALVILNIDFMSTSKAGSIDLKQAKIVLDQNCTLYGLVMNVVLKFIHKNEGKCGVLSVTSMLGVEGFPGYAIYSGSKGFQNFLSISMWKYGEEKADFLSYQPYLIRRRELKSLTSFFSISPEDAARTSLRDLGSRRWTLGHWKHGVASWILYNFPSFARSMFIRSQCRTIDAIQKKKL